MEHSVVVRDLVKRFGSFAALYGLENTIAMIDGALARSA
jgi:hypothetical protein